MRTSCASDLPSHLVRQLGRLPELLDEITSPVLLDVVVSDGFGNPVSQADLLGRFAYTGLEELAGEGLHAAATTCYDPTPGRWVGRDPVGLEAGDSNLSRFVASDLRGIWVNEDGTICEA